MGTTMGEYVECPYILLYMDGIFPRAEEHSTFESADEKIDVVKRRGEAKKMVLLEVKKVVEVHD